MAYSQSVEQWRSLLSKYFKPEDMDKALYVLQGESGGNPNAISNSGGYGLFQLNDGGLGEGYTTAQRLDPETNVRVAAQAVYGGSGWAPWGEGTYGQPPYDPKTGKGSFGVLGNAPYEGGGGSVPVGNYDADINEYFNQAEDAWRRLEAYKKAHPGRISGDGGVVYLDPNNPAADDDGWVIDMEGTTIMQEALDAEASIDRLVKRREAGIGQSGNDAATAYLNSEKEKSAESTRKYENFVTRIQDLAAMEDLPTARAQAMATALSAANKETARGSGTFHQMGSGMGLSGRKPLTDFSSFAASLKSTIPAEAPAFREVAAGALEPSQPGGSGSSYPARQTPRPEEILASSGIAPTLAEDRMSARDFNTSMGAIPDPNAPRNVPSLMGANSNATEWDAFGNRQPNPSISAFDRLSRQIMNANVAKSKQRGQYTPAAFVDALKPVTRKEKEDLRTTRRRKK